MLVCLYINLHALQLNNPGIIIKDSNKNIRCISKNLVLTYKLFKEEKADIKVNNVSIPSSNHCPILGFCLKFICQESHCELDLLL